MCLSTWQLQSLGTYVTLDASLVHNLVDLVGRHTRLRGSGGNIKDLSRKLAGLAHSLLGLLVEDLDLVSVREGAAVLGVPVLPPCRVRDGLGQGAVLGQRVDGAEGAGVGIVGERVVVAGCWIW